MWYNECDWECVRFIKFCFALDINMLSNNKKLIKWPFALTWGQNIFTLEFSLLKKFKDAILLKKNKTVLN